MINGLSNSNSGILPCISLCWQIVDSLPSQKWDNLQVLCCGKVVRELMLAFKNSGFILDEFQSSTPTLLLQEMRPRNIFLHVLHDKTRLPIIYIYIYMYNQSDYIIDICMFTDASSIMIHARRLWLSSEFLRSSPGVAMVVLILAVAIPKML